MEINVSIIGLIIQCVGILIVMGLSSFMTRSIKRLSLEYWTLAWVALSVSLVALSLAFNVRAFARLYFFFYYFSEYLFGLLFIAGCRNFSTGEKLTRRDWKWGVAALAIALLLASLPIHFNKRFMLHFAIVALLFWSAYRALAPARRRAAASPGLRVMSTALMLLTINFIHYIPVFAIVIYFNFPRMAAYLSFTSIYDMLLETLLGFGTVMVVMEDLRHEVEGMNTELLLAQTRLETLARIDPLTEAFNRHAFYSLTEAKPNQPLEKVSGCVVVIDIDDLKPINDKLGHTVGDSAIREVASSLRSIIRAEDMLFRWGGDEFLILMLNNSEEMVNLRLSELLLSLQPNSALATLEPIPILFSYGISAFAGLAEIEQAIEKADTAMYTMKKRRKTTLTTSSLTSS
ncbi:MAG: GGDEF domain-containing protein [Acidobacteria bacterium]|nr:GGDEF domain-containing protein [Acidobacteriota bacterium]